jgi:hypothetical protein
LGPIPNPQSPIPILYVEICTYLIFKLKTQKKF